VGRPELAYRAFPDETHRSRPKLGSQLFGLFTIARLAHSTELEQRTQALVHQALVVDQQDANFFGVRHSRRPVGARRGGPDRQRNR
jgi:hypothetical protein